MARRVTHRKVPPSQQLILEKLALRQQIDDYRIRIESMEKDIIKKESSIKTLTDKNKNLQDDYDNLIEQKHIQNGKIEGLQKTISSLNDEYDSLNKKIDKTNKELNKAHMNMSSYKEKALEYKATQNDIDSLNVELQKCKSDIEYAKKRKQVFLNDVRASELSFEEASKDYDNAIVQKRKAEFIIDKSLKSLKEDIENKTKEYKDIKRQVLDAKANQEYEIKKLQAKAYKLEDEAIMFEKKRDDLKGEVEREKKRYLKYKEQLI